MKTEIISSIFSHHNAMKLEINYKEKNDKKHKHVRLNSMLLNNQWFKEETKEEIKSMQTNENESTAVPNLGDIAKAVLREAYSNTVLTQETNKENLKQPNLTSETTRESRTNTT